MGKIAVKVVATRPVRINGERRPAGYELTDEDQAGRDLAGMEARGEIMTVVERDGEVQARRPSRN